MALTTSEYFEKTAFRTSEYLQRYELVRFQLDDVIRAQPTVNINIKMGISLRLMTDLHSTIGTMLISRCNFRCNYWLMEQPPEQLEYRLLMELIH